MVPQKGCLCWKKLNQKQNMVMFLPTTAYEIQQCFLFYCRFVLRQMGLLRFFLCQRWCTQPAILYFFFFIFFLCCFTFWFVMMIMLLLLFVGGDIGYTAQSVSLVILELIKSLLLLINFFYLFFDTIFFV
jgi:hypothetical protein